MIRSLTVPSRPTDGTAGTAGTDSTEALRRSFATPSGSPGPTIPDDEDTDQQKLNDLVEDTPWRENVRPVQQDVQHDLDGGEGEPDEV